MTQPANSEAARLYAEGLERVRRLDNLGARPLFEKAIAADPKFALAHPALSEVWRFLGNQPEATAQARFARRPILRERPRRAGRCSASG